MDLPGLNPGRARLGSKTPLLGHFDSVIATIGCNNFVSEMVRIRNKNSKEQTTQPLERVMHFAEVEQP